MQCCSYLFLRVWNDKDHTNRFMKDLQAKLNFFPLENCNFFILMKSLSMALVFFISSHKTKLPLFSICNLLCKYKQMHMLIELLPKLKTHLWAVAALDSEVNARKEDLASKEAACSCAGVVQQNRENGLLLIQNMKPLHWFTVWFNLNCSNNCTKWSFYTYTKKFRCEHRAICVFFLSDLSD